jgi:uncharacterized protein (UPF0335 family)
MPYSADIERVEQHISEIEQRIDRQNEVIAQAEGSGLSTKGARAFLWVLKESLSMSRDHLARLLADQAIATNKPD